MKRRNKAYLLFSKNQRILATLFFNSVKDQIVSPFQHNHCPYLHISKGREWGGNRSSTDTFTIKTGFHISFQMGEVFCLVCAFDNKMHTS